MADPNSNAAGGAGQGEPDGNDCPIITGGPRMLGEDGRWVNNNMGEGYYIFFNPLIGNTCEALKDGINEAINGGVAYRPYPIKYIANNSEDWTFASKQVRGAGEHGKYPCGDAMPNTFFDDDKMTNTINMIILYVGEKDIPYNLRTRASAAAEVSGETNQTEPTRKKVTYAFAVVRDLCKADVILDRIGSQQEVEYFKDLINGPGKIYKENCLYIEGLCAAPQAGKGRGAKLMDLIHILAFYSKYDGCKLSALAYVIQYYFNKFSYRFRKDCSEESPTINHLNNEVNKLPRISDDEIIEEEVAWNIASRRPWPPFIQSLTEAGFNTEISREQGKTVASLRNFMVMNEEDEEYNITTRKAKMWERLGMLEQGFKMYFCFRNHPLMGVIQGRPTPFTQFVVMKEDTNEDRGWQKIKKKSKKKSVASASIVSKNPFAALNNNSNTQQSNSNTQQSNSNTQQSNSNTERSTTSGNTTSGSNTSGGNTSGSNTSGGNTSGSNTSGSTTGNSSNSQGGRRTRRKRRKRRRRKTRHRRKTCHRRKTRHRHKTRRHHKRRPRRKTRHRGRKRARRRKK